MAKFNLRIKKSARKELESIATKGDRQRIVKRILALAGDPRPFGSQEGSQKLSGLARYRIRQGRYRILYSIEDTELVVYVIGIGDRKGVYRR